MIICIILLIIRYIAVVLGYYNVFIILVAINFMIMVITGSHITYLFNKKLFNFTLNQRGSLFDKEAVKIELTNCIIYRIHNIKYFICNCSWN